MNITTTYDEAMVKAMIAEAVAHCTKHGCVPKQPAPAQQEPVDAVWFQDANGALRKAPKDCQSFDANGVPIAVWVNGVWYPRPQAREPEQPAQQCKWPTCQSEEYQQALAEQIRRELVGEQPAQQQGRVRELECCIADLKAECQALRAEREPVALEEYDAGLLNDFGGGNVEWWQDYIRAELGRAYEHYQSQMATPQPPAQRQPLTDEQMWALWNSQGDDAMEQQAAIAFARAIEAAHNIKEHT